VDVFKSKGKVHISTSNYHVRPIFNLKPQNQISCILKLSKSCKLPPPNPNHPGFDPTWHMVLVHVTNQCMRHSPCLPALAGHGCSALQTPVAELRP